MSFRRTGWPLAALVTVAALVAAGCGSSSTKAPATSAGSATTAAAGSVPAGAPGSFGTLSGICGPGDAKGATDQGVTDNEIVLGTMADPGNTVVPGLNQELFDTADTFVAWCNSAGGILGRKIVLNKRDAKLMEAAPRMVEACQTDFMLVGNGAALDDTTVTAREACGLPQIATFTVGVRSGTAKLSLLAIPNSQYQSHLSGVFLKLKELDPSVLGAFGELNSQLPSLNGAGKRNAQAAVDAGFTKVYYEETPAAVDNWRTFAENIKAKGVQVLSIEDTPENGASLLKAMNDVGYFPKYFVFEANFYNPKLIEEAGAALGQTTVLINADIVPFELAGADFPATAQYIALLKATTGQSPRALGINAMSAWLLWAQSATACGSNLTRACVLEQASKVKGWTAGGLHSPTDPANSTGSNTLCFLTLQATEQGFVVRKDITKPNQGIFNCDPANQPTVTGYQP